MVDVSVVMSVYDEPVHVQKTIESVLKQTGVEFEFIIVSDGASAAVLSVLKHYGSDPRIKIIEQVNSGLTKALIMACKAAQGEFIARIDAGDVMRVDRLRIQANRLASNPKLGFVSSYVSVETVEGYFLYQIEHSGQVFKGALRSHKVEEMISPFHASVMFKKRVYEAVGGYRKEFYFTQDVDLWSRMIECSEIDVIEKTLTTGIFSSSGISGKYRAYQVRLVELIVKANRLRQSGGSDAETLAQAKLLRPGGVNLKQKESRFDSLYFLARVLSTNKSINAKEYWLRAIKSKPFSIKSWLFYFLSFRYKK